jgi:hypothetical protein
MPFPGRGSNPTSAWRTEVRAARQRLLDEIQQLTPAQLAEQPVVLARAALERARAAVDEPRSPWKWWTGDQVERSWRSVKEAQANLVLVALDMPARTRIAAAVPWVPSASGWALPGALGGNAQALHRTIVAAHSAADQSFIAARQLRNILWLTTVILATLAGIALILDSSHRGVILLGGLAGALTGILPLSNATKLTGPYGITAVQVLLKVPAGAIAALLGVYLLANSVGTLPAASGRTQYFYAVLFGLSQQALTSIADSQAKGLAK